MEEENIYHKVHNYLNRSGIPFSGNKVCFVDNGIILASIDLSDYDINHDTYIEIIEASNSNKFIDFDYL